MKFNYLARDLKGETQTGVIEASDYSAALKILQDKGLIVVNLKIGGRALLISREIKIFNRIKRKDIFVFFRQLAILVDADVPLVQSLNILSKQTESRSLKDIISATASDVDGGMAFSKAMGKHPKVFSIFSVNLIKSGEISGRLQETLNYLADYLEKEFYLISRVRGAMTYPAFILGAFIIVGVLVMTMVIPNLTSILLEAEQELPFSTKIVIWTSDFIRGSWWLILTFLIVFGFVIARYKKTARGKFYWDMFKLKIPIFGKIFQKTYLARIADNLGTLVKGGVSIIQSLNITGQVVGNAIFQQIIFQARDDVKVGKSISSVLEERDEFPPLFSQMVKTGEKTGKLDLILEKISIFYSKEVDNIVNNLSQIIEPLLIVILGVGVSILVFAVFIPIYNLAGAF
ncbi:type II secretion system F family protein [Patescibacteria group bacterium]|nr:type II secretion system F family protein [Patescibacteria group bacterium]